MYDSRSTPITIASGIFIEAVLNPVNGWFFGSALTYAGQRWLPLGRLLGCGGLAAQSGQTWRGDGVQPDWWACAVGGCAYAVTFDLLLLRWDRLALPQMSVIDLQYAFAAAATSNTGPVVNAESSSTARTMHPLRERQRREVGWRDFSLDVWWSCRGRLKFEGACTETT